MIGRYFLRCCLVLATICSLSSLAMAQKTIQGKMVRQIFTDLKPSYFFKASLDGHYIGFTTHVLTPEDANFILDTHTGHTHSIPGWYDPVFNLDDQVVTIPYKKSQGFNFYSLNTLLSQGREAKPLYYDRDMTGEYQSIGLLERTEGHSIYRMFVGRGGFENYTREYEATYQSGKPLNLKPIGNRKPICTNVSIKLPMISKNGKELAAFTQTSNRIYRIEDSGDCTEVLDLKLSTGKISFSYDSRKIAFHVYAGQNDQTDYVQFPPNSDVADIFVYDRDTNVLKRVTENKSDNSVFPEFLENGNLVFINYPHDSTQKVSFIEVALE